MKLDIIAQFESNWKDFDTKVRAQIGKRCNGQIPSFSVLAVILEDCKMDWGASDTRNGRWLTNLAKDYPKAANLIQKILLEDMKFEQRVEKNGISSTVKTVAPMAGAAAGFAFSHFVLHAPVVTQVVCTVGLAVALPPIMKKIDANVNEKNIHAETNQYMEQLQKYYISIKSVLETCEG